jgi:hypothetical protein
MTNAATSPADSTTALVDKVRKLLAMAEGTANPNEADAFSRKAAELIAEHRIQPEQLRAVSRDDLAVDEFPLGRGAYVRGRLALLQAVAEASGCQVVFQAKPTGTVAYVAGFRADLDTVGLLYHSLHTQASGRMGRERRATGDEIRTMLADTAREATSRLHPSSTALPALRERDRRVDEFARRSFGRVVAARRPKAATAQGFVAGREAAARADLGRSRVGGRRALGRGA